MIETSQEFWRFMGLFALGEGIFVVVVLAAIKWIRRKRMK
jgi:hypothetical protein